MDRNVKQTAIRQRQQAAHILDNMQWVAGGALGLLTLSLLVNMPSLPMLIANAALGVLFLAVYRFDLQHPEWNWLTWMLVSISIPLASVRLSEKLGSSDWYLLQGPLTLFATFSLLALLLRPYLRRLAEVPIKPRYKKAA